MRLTHPFWYWNKSLSLKFCDDIIKFAKSKRKRIAQTKSLKRDAPILSSVRDSNITWLDETWIYREIQPYLKLANENANWNFEIDNAEPCQFTIYNSNQFYGWHTDRFDKEDLKRYDKGRNRKLSMTLCLSDRKEYTGGDLEFVREGPPDIKPDIVTNKELGNKGSICFFPSFMWHRVKPVTKGTRYSLVIWFSGKDFR